VSGLKGWRVKEAYRKKKKMYYLFGCLILFGNGQERT
jgi:hypothetical protein